MKKAVEDAVEIFCNDILNLKLENAKTLGKSFYGASIPLYEDKKELEWFLYFKKATLKKIAQILLLEDNIDEEDIDDLIKEITNQIIGLAKVKLESKNQNTIYKLGTPKFLGNTTTPSSANLEDALLYKIQNRTFLVARAKEQKSRIQK